MDVFWKERTLPPCVSVLAALPGVAMGTPACAWAGPRTRSERQGM